MSIYYVNDSPQPTGEHEVHKQGCAWLNEVASKTELGWHFNCQNAVDNAKEVYANADGCIHCIPECHFR